jgi:hypothetical protein
VGGGGKRENKLAERRTKKGLKLYSPSQALLCMSFLSNQWSLFVVKTIDRAKSKVLI